MNYTVTFVWWLAVLASLTNILTVMPNLLGYMKEYTLLFFFLFFKLSIIIKINNVLSQSTETRVWVDPICVSAGNLIAEISFSQLLCCVLPHNFYLQASRLVLPDEASAVWTLGMEIRRSYRGHQRHCANTASLCLLAALSLAGEAGAGRQHTDSGKHKLWISPAAPCYTDPLWRSMPRSSA